MRDLHNRVGHFLDLAFMRDDLELHLFGQPISGKEIRLFAESLDLDDGQSTHADAHQLALYGVQSVGANDCNHVTQFHCRLLHCVPVKRAVPP